MRASPTFCTVLGAVWHRVQVGFRSKGFRRYLTCCFWRCEAASWICSRSDVWRLPFEWLLSVPIESTPAVTDLSFRMPHAVAENEWEVPKPEARKTASARFREISEWMTTTCQSWRTWREDDRGTVAIAKESYITQRVSIHGLPSPDAHGLGERVGKDAQMRGVLCSCHLGHGSRLTPTVHWSPYVERLRWLTDNAMMHAPQQAPRPPRTPHSQA